MIKKFPIQKYFKTLSPFSSVSVVHHTQIHNTMTCRVPIVVNENMDFHIFNIYYFITYK